MNLEIYFRNYDLEKYPNIIKNKAKYHYTIIQPNTKL